MTIKIVTDSTCDLPQEIMDKHGIAVVPLFINVGDKGYSDGVDITRAEFYARLPHFPQHPTTAFPPPDAFKDVYERLTEEGATEILSIHIASSLSGTANAALLGSREAKSAPVTVLDSGQFSLAMGFAVQKALDLIAQSVPVKEIVAALQDQLKRTYMYAAVDSFEYLRRSGRVGMLAAGIGTLLRIKPILAMHDNKASSMKARTHRRAVDLMIDLITNLAPLERLGFIHTEDPTPAEELKARLRHLWPAGTDVLSVSVTPVVGAHVGMGGLGIIAVGAKRG
jgi:DegV family protein with EDD domain